MGCSASYHGFLVHKGGLASGFVVGHCSVHGHGLLFLQFFSGWMSYLSEWTRSSYCNP